MINLSSIFPTVTAATGPSNGTSEIAKAAEVPIRAGTSAGWMPSDENTLHKICTSALKSFGKRGRMQWSIRRATNCSDDPGRGSRLP